MNNDDISIRAAIAHAIRRHSGMLILITFCALTTIVVVCSV